MSFETTADIRFAHVDAAGIVFYPRYFEMLNAAVEDWFTQELGVDFRTMHQERAIGVPTVHVSADFQAPSVLGDRLTVRLTPRHVGRTSCSYDALFTASGRDRLKISGTLVCMCLRTQKAVPWPADIRDRMEHTLATAP